jgi:hypothetical protein
MVHNSNQAIHRDDYCDDSNRPHIPALRSIWSLACRSELEYVQVWQARDRRAGCCADREPVDPDDHKHDARQIQLSLLAGINPAMATVATAGIIGAPSRQHCLAGLPYRGTEGLR